MTRATAIRWTAIATDAPWFPDTGTRLGGSAGPAFEPRLALTMAVMVSAVIPATCGRSAPFVP
jgi:hypothetical protein